jgi:hypothetical protein
LKTFVTNRIFHSKQIIMAQQNFRAEANKISLEATSAPEFCRLWPTVKTGLELLQGLLKNPVLKAIVGTIIGAGDAVASRICNP